MLLQRHLLISRRISKTLLLLSLNAAISLCFLSCIPGHYLPLSGSTEKYRPARIRSGVPSRPGSAAWSPDGGTLAFISGGIVLYDAGTGVEKKVSIDDPLFLAWSPDNLLFVLYRDQGHDALGSLRPDSLEFRKIFVPGGAAIYTASDKRTLLVVERRIRDFSFGTEIALGLSSYRFPDTTEKSLYASSKTYAVKQLNWRYFLGWMHAGLNPVDNSLLVFEQTKPPAKAPYSRVIMVDFLTGDAREISGHPQQKMYISASWSPDGTMFAASDWNGRIEILSLDHGRSVLNEAPTGFYPSWNPRGDIIYAGGHLFDWKGSRAEALLENAEWSLGAWSPDGTSLAVITGGELWLFRDIHPRPGPALKRDEGRFTKMKLLQNLFRDSLISREEYQERRNELMSPEKSDR